MDIVQKLRSQRTMSMFAKSEHLYETLNHDRREAADEIARLRAEIDNIKQVEFPRRVEKVADGWRNKSDRAEAEIARLRAQAQHEADCAEAYKAEADRLRDENAKLRADAERYRWLRDSAEAWDWEMIGYQDSDKTDAAIDAAMSSSGELNAR